ncbi:YesL family protein [Streptomyces sp. NPDC060205]|uniref:YesL family protein n=1 Tax=Streptomyces sp. NPDC060205 TaxID=3347072 RepID=UPI0036626256
MKPNSFLHTACGWVARLAWLNVLWLAATLCGAVVAGFFPATAAVFAVLRRWMTDPDSREKSTAASFWRLARPEMLRANAVGYGATAVVALLTLDLWLTRTHGGPLAGVLFAASVAATALVAATLVQLPFVYVHLEAPVLTLVRTAWWYALSRPADTLAVLAAWVAASYAMGRYPGLTVFFGMTAVAALTVRLGLRGFAVVQAGASGRADGGSSSRSAPGSSPVGSGS